MAATATQRGKSQSHLLHRDLPQPTLKPWEGQRLQRCDAVYGNGEGVALEHRSAQPPPARDGRRPAGRIGAPVVGFSDDDGSLEELREKLLGHLREAADRMKFDVLPMNSAATAATAVAAAVEPPPSCTSVEAVIPWTLRARKPSQRALESTAMATPAKAAERTVRLRSEDPEKKEQWKFSVALSSEEIEEDVFSLTGSRPRRRPKKRPRIVQRQLDAVFPGLWLSEISPESYRVPE